MTAPGGPAEPPLDPRLDHAPCAFVAFDVDGVVRAANATLGTLLGADAAGCVGRPVEELLTRAGRLFWQAQVLPLLRARGRADELYLPLRRADGTELPVLATAVRRGGDGMGTTDCVLMPVWERRRFEGALLAAQGAAEAAAATLRDEQRALERANAQLQEQQAELAVANEHLHEQQVELEITNEQLQDNAAELEAQADELQATTAHLEERTEAAEAAERTTARILAAAGEGILGLAPDGTTTFVNPAAARLLGYAEAELIGGPQHALIHHHWPDGAPYLVAACPIYRALREGVPCRVDTEVFWRKDGTPVPVEYTATPAVEDGQIVGAVLSFQDISARRAATAERERLIDVARTAQTEAETARAVAEHERARADAANAGKSQFLANMSHELRTPLNAIGGYTQLVELGIHGPVTDDQRQALVRVQAAQQRLLSLINDVLNYAKLEGGRVEYAMAAVDLRDVVADVAPLVAPQLAAKGIAFDVRLPDGPCAVWADREKLGQVVVNLLSNATKFTAARDPATGAPGRVTVDVATRPGADDLAVFLRVADTGRGIPADKLQSVFEPFVQVETGYARPGEGGTGLGLAISRDLARGMGGDLRARSEEGVGATFTVTLRRVAAPDGTPLDRRTYEERRAEDDRRDGEDRRRVGGIADAHGDAAADGNPAGSGVSPA